MFYGSFRMRIKKPPNNISTPSGRSLTVETDRNFLLRIWVRMCMAMLEGHQSLGVMFMGVYESQLDLRATQMHTSTIHHVYVLSSRHSCNKTQGMEYNKSFIEIN